MTECTASPWIVGNVCRDGREAARTNVPVPVSEVTRECLTNAEASIGARHDTVTRTPGTPSFSREPDEVFLMTREAAAALEEARTEVAAQIGVEYDIWVNGAWDSSHSVHGVGSRHNWGAALDLVLCRLPCASGASKVTDPLVLGMLPPILVEAGFTWVWYEDPRHVHASISSPSLSECGCTPSRADVPGGGCHLFGRCTHPDEPETSHGYDLYCNGATCSCSVDGTITDSFPQLGSWCTGIDDAWALCDFP
jgi:hypothetical protein